MAQSATPQSVVNQGGWTGAIGNLSDASDATTLASPVQSAAGSTAAYQALLSIVADPFTLLNHGLVVRARKTNSAVSQNVRVQLWQNGVNVGAQLQQSLTTTLTTYGPLNFTISPGVVDYSQPIEIRFIANNSNATATATSQVVIVDARVDVPDQGPDPGWPFTSIDHRGHSYGAPSSNGASTPSNAYPELLRTRLRRTLRNYAAGGSLISQTGATPTGKTPNYGTAYDLMRTLTPPRDGSVLVSNDYSINDLNLGEAAGPLDTTFEDYVAGLHAERAQQRWENDHAVFGAPPSGWSTVASTTNNSGPNYLGASVDTVGTIVGNFTGANAWPGGDMLVWFIGGDGNPAKGGEFEIALDFGAGPQIIGVHDSRGNVATAQRPVRKVFRIPDVSAGDVVLTVDTLAVYNAFLAFDGVTLENASSPTCMVFMQPRLPAGGYAAHGGGTEKYGDAQVDAYNAKLATLPGRFPARAIILVPVPAGQDANAAHFNDLVHFNDTGHDARADAAEAAIAAWADTTAPVVTITAGPTRVRMSRQVGADSSDVTFQSSEAFTAYEVRVVPNSGSPRSAGTLLESGGAGAAATPYTITVTDDELVAAAAVEGANALKVFCQDAAGNWSG